MDPVGPWSAYASYNRLAGVQTTAATGELHSAAAAAAAAPPTTTAQLLPGGFLSSPSVAYETVLPFFHHASAKPPAHYVAQVSQHRQVLAQTQGASKQSSEGEYHQPQAFFEQGANVWQQNSPFGILPHESVIPSTSANKTAAYENFNAHFAAAQTINQLNLQVAASNAKNSSAARAQSPQVSNTSSKATPPQGSSGTFYQTSTTFAVTENSPSSKTYPSSTTANLQQSCIVSSASNTVASKDYRVPQASRNVYLGSPTPPRPTASAPAPSKQSQPPQIQTKAQTKIYPEISNQSAERQRNASDDNPSQSSPISFSIMDAPGRLNYVGSNSSGKRPQFPQHSNYRHYQTSNNQEPDFQRQKTGSDYNNSNGPDCNVVTPRRPSPLQAHSQASPIGHAQSPVYPMYNSPLNSISSPQQPNSTTQVQPPSPLDVSVPRPNSQTGSVAYPSVITRALNTDKGFTEQRYERTNQQPQQANQQQNCWDERQPQLQRKFQNQPPTPVSTYNSIEVASRPGELPTRVEPQQRGGNQLGYFEAGHQVTLQDLSSCRGDPMSIVKNLQQQQGCQVAPQPEVKQEVKAPSKRRKSNEKANSNPPSEIPIVVSNPDSAMADYFPGRVPPPAHSSITNPQQPNGAYFDFDRWNLPPPSSKIFSAQPIHQQHLMPHPQHPHPHHPPPPLPYFPPFHLAPHPPEFPPTVELVPAAYNEQQHPHHQQHQPQQQSQPQQQQAVAQAPVGSEFNQQQEEQRKVVVPNVEEELNFLSDDKPRPVSSQVPPPIVRPTPPSVPVPPPKADKPAGPSAGFMNSYLKFLQGERDSSPPPSNRAGRKSAWPRSKPPQPEVNKEEMNGVNTPPAAPPPPVPPTRLSQGDPQDDPRYFPLPKERPKDYFNSSDDGFSSEEDLFSKKQQGFTYKPEPPVREKLSKPPKKPKPSKPEKEKKERKPRKNSKAAIDNQPDGLLEQNIPRRETSKRAAKEKTNFSDLMKQTADDELEEPPEFVDSDSDPAWTPQAKEDAEEEFPIKKGRKGGKKRLSRNLAADVALYRAGIQEDDGESIKRRKSKSNKLVPKNSDALVLESKTATPVAEPNNCIPYDDVEFKAGDFVVIRSEYIQKWPAIWRVDGKTLLQKYEPFEQNGKTLYRSISTYTSWTPDSKRQYMIISVRSRSESNLETVVEYLHTDTLLIDDKYFEKAMKDGEVYQDNFEVYIQTLISQALDRNFLTEIFQEQDEYFLTNVKKIDDVTQSKQQRLLQLLKWPNTIRIAVTTWPCFNISRELGPIDAMSKPCSACQRVGVAVRVFMYGQPYNSTTLEGCQPDPQSVHEKNFFICWTCAKRVELFNKVTHQKYLMYIECAKRVAEKRTSDPHKDTTCILNELLADENWLNQLFKEVRSSWASVDSLVHSFNQQQSNSVNNTKML